MSTLPLHPPTSPIVVVAPPPPPTSRSASWSLLCGVAGLQIPIPLSLIAIGLGIRALRVTRSGSGYLGRGYAIGGLVTGAIGVLLIAFYSLMGLMVAMSVEQVHVIAMGNALERVHGAALHVAQSEGRYPDHVAKALLDPQYTTLVHHMVVGGDVPSPGEVMVGEYDCATWDASDESRAALKAALEKIDVSAPYYRFGEARIVRLPSPTGEPAIVYAWTIHRDAEMIAFIFDDGSFRPARFKEWASIWKADAAARERRGLPQFEPDGP